MNVWPILCSDFLEIASDRFRDELDSSIRKPNESILLLFFLMLIARMLSIAPSNNSSPEIRRPLPTNILFTNFALYGGLVSAWRMMSERTVQAAARIRILEATDEFPRKKNLFDRLTIGHLLCSQCERKEL